MPLMWRSLSFAFAFSLTLCNVLVHLPFSNNEHKSYSVMRVKGVHRWHIPFGSCSTSCCNQNLFFFFFFFFLFFCCFFFRENTYVRVFGHLKSFKENSRSLIAFGLSPVTDFNEITYHMLDVVHSHLALSKVRMCVFCFCFFNSLVMKLGCCCRKSTSLFYDNVPPLILH